MKNKIILMLSVVVSFLLIIFGIKSCQCFEKNTLKITSATAFEYARAIAGENDASSLQIKTLYDFDVEKIEYYSSNNFSVINNIKITLTEDAVVNKEKGLDNQLLDITYNVSEKDFEEYYVQIDKKNGKKSKIGKYYVSDEYTLLSGIASEYTYEILKFQNENEKTVAYIYYVYQYPPLGFNQLKAVKVTLDKEYKLRLKD